MTDGDIAIKADEELWFSGDRADVESCRSGGGDGDGSDWLLVFSRIPDGDGAICVGNCELSVIEDGQIQGWMWEFPVGNCFLGGEIYVLQVRASGNTNGSFA